MASEKIISRTRYLPLRCIILTPSLSRRFVIVSKVFGTLILTIEITPVLPYKIANTIMLADRRFLTLKSTITKTTNWGLINLLKHFVGVQTYFVLACSVFMSCFVSCLQNSAYECVSNVHEYSNKMQKRRKISHLTTWLWVIQYKWDDHKKWISWHVQLVKTVQPTYLLKSFVLFLRHS